MIWQRADDLRGYLRDAVLPELKYGPETPDLPPLGHKSHRNTLSTRFRKHRHLTAIHYLGPSFDEIVNEWISARLPAKSTGFRGEDQQSGEALTVPSARRFKVCTAVPAPAADSARLWTWVHHFPLRTVQTVLHIIFPKIRDWDFVSDDSGTDNADIYKEFYFTDTRNPTSPEIRSNSVVVVCQPPWVLADEDMWQFTELKSLPVDNVPLRAKERLWAKVWDTCVRRQSTYFVVTSYQQWVFGAFSRGFTHAFVSPPMGAQSRDPTVIQAAIYWLASALAVEYGYVPPYVPEPVDYVMGDIPIPPHDNNDDIATIIDSLSSWTGKSEEPASSAHAAEVIPALGSERGASGEVSDWAPMPYVRPRDLVATRLMVEQWRQSLPGCDGAQVAELCPPPSPQDLDRLYGGDLWTDDPDDAACTVSSDHTEIGETKGHWLTRFSFLCTH